MTIHKYPLPVEDRQTLEMPRGARVLCVQAQEDKPQLWALVDPFETSKDKRTFYTYGTGHYVAPEMADKGQYVGTYQLRGGSLVFHVFEEMV